MNRRKFIAALLATPLLSHVALSDEVTECVKPKPLTNPRVLIVSPTYAQAERIWKHMKHKEAAMVMGVGGALCGRQFDYIIVDEAIGRGDRQVDEWLYDSVFTRLSPTGSTIDLRWGETDYNYGTTKTIQATFSDPDKTRYDMNAVRWPYAMDDERRYKSRAALLDWYIEQRGWHE